MTTTRIAILEDNEIIVRQIGNEFEKHHWQFESFGLLSDLSNALADRKFDLLLLDWSLPDGQADQVIDQVRRTLLLDTPIIIESIDADEQQVINALELGADDYVVKPLRLAELTQRIKALLRRSGHFNEAQQPLARLGDITMDSNQKQISLKGSAVAMTAKEYELAEYILNRPDSLITRAELFKNIWGQDSTLRTRTMDVHIARIRSKLELAGEHDMQLVTLRGYGYRLQTMI